ncbi:methyltransferase (plasmid) [Pseudonocardia sp. EC080625-04]|uniref:methyltransferase n=1 Tax=unclassified Pseudonocardia TaxID=2619320 RepID=UPI0006CB4A76|nr:MULTISPECIES: methyltransferase [unclassified Pseudonocardia]ALE76901.1 methyltransferase [Pseudonocardia sp. EC080625-04]ALL85883.1 methyltransferase [Pseudonocardia sp. EC080619-01]
MDQQPVAQSIMALADLATPMSVRVAATLGLVEHAGDEGATAEQLAAETGSFTPAIRCLLDHLVSVGVFDHDPETGLYWPTSLGAQMGEDSSAGFKILLDINTAGGRGELAFVDLLKTVTTGESAYVSRYGREFWDDLAAHPHLRRTFDAQMNWRFRKQAPQIAERFDWSRFSKILDVGGGDGIVLDAILRAHPGVRGQVLDLKPTADAAARRFAAAGLEGRASAVPGSFFNPLPTGADVYLLSDIVHDWDDDHARQILVRCRDAAADDAAIVLIEPVRGHGASTGIDLFMLLCFGGRERTVDELTRLAAEAGLETLNVAPVADGRMALEFAIAPDGHRFS